MLIDVGLQRPDFSRLCSVKAYMKGYGIYLDHAAARFLIVPARSIACNNAHMRLYSESCMRPDGVSLFFRLRRFVLSCVALCV